MPIMMHLPTVETIPLATLKKYKVHVAGNQVWIDHPCGWRHYLPNGSSIGDMVEVVWDNPDACMCDE